MAIRFADLWRWDGGVGRLQYALVGLVGFAIKHNLDRLVASGAFHRRWGIFNYWVPLDQAARFTKLSASDQSFLGTMLLLSLPFIWVGVTITLRRLRDAQQPPWLVALFFVPFVNLVFFLLLCALPGKLEASAKAEGRGALAVLVPESGLGSALAGAIATALFGVATTWLGVTVFGGYGWSLFVALPFVMGYAAAWLYSYHEPRGRWACVGVAWLAVLVAGAGIVAVAIEGIVCLAMAAPIALPLATFGALIAYYVQNRRWNGAPAPAGLAVVLLCVPLLMGAEYASPEPEPQYEVRTAIEIAAPPEKVWKQVVAFAEIPPPQELLFRAGIAYPIRAEIQGHGVGAERHCVFSTGAFVEPIEVWDEPRLLKFSVASNPPPMQEWTPYRHVAPLHLRGYFTSNGGQFLLTPLPNGGTRLEGTTWYRHNLWPATYWKLWSDAIIHRIHLRVLRHIKVQAEAHFSGKRDSPRQERAEGQRSSLRSRQKGGQAE